MSDKFVSVIIPSYNSGRFLSKCVGSVLAQTYKNHEIIIIDDGSTDGTRELVKREFEDRVRYHYQENKGLAGARNTGIGLARGQFIQFLDADDWIAPNKFENQIHAFDDPEVQVVYSDYDLVDENGTSVPGGADRMKMGSYENDSSILDRLMKECVLIVHSTLVRARVLQLEGGFDENRRMSEDWELWLRLASRGYRFKFVPGKFAYYLKYGTSMSNDFELQHARRLSLLMKFMSDEKFRSLGDKRFNSFCAYQYRALADDCWNAKRWSKARKYLRKALIYKGLRGFGDGILYLKTYAHQFTDKFTAG